MKFYKLELINREQSYNAMFGAQPQVGLMNPTTKLGKQNTVAPLPMGAPKDMNRKQMTKAIWYANTAITDRDQEIDQHKK